MMCKQCGEQLPENAKFCERCGAPVPLPDKAEAPPQSTAATCAACGASLAPGTKFCQHCGAPAGTGTAAPSGQPDTRVACSLCGASNPTGSRFCEHCGSPLRKEDHAQARSGTSWASPAGAGPSSAARPAEEASSEGAPAKSAANASASAAAPPLGAAAAEAQHNEQSEETHTARRAGKPWRSRGLWVTGLILLCVGALLYVSAFRANLTLADPVAMADLFAEQGSRALLSLTLRQFGGLISWPVMINGIILLVWGLKRPKPRRDGKPVSRTKRVIALEIICVAGAAAMVFGVRLWFDSQIAGLWQQDVAATAQLALRTRTQTSEGEPVAIWLGGGGDREAVLYSQSGADLTESELHWKPAYNLCTSWIWLYDETSDTPVATAHLHLNLTGPGFLQFSYGDVIDSAAMPLYGQIDMDQWEELVSDVRSGAASF